MPSIEKTQESQKGTGAAALLRVHSCAAAYLDKDAGDALVHTQLVQDTAVLIVSVHPRLAFIPDPQMFKEASTDGRVLTDGRQVVPSVHLMTCACAWVRNIVVVGE